MVYSLVEEILMRENMTPHSFPYLEILNNLDIGIALFDAEGNYLFVNTELVNWRNIPMLEFLKMNVHDFLNILDVCVFDLVKKKNHRVSRLQYYKNKDHVDSKRRLRVVTGTPIFDENGKIKYVIMALQDVESFENLYQALLRQNQIVSFGSGKELVEGADIVAKSSSFRALLEVADNVASLDSTVLLYGESGSGKEILANYIHQRSDRREKPMITVNCAAFSENLIESELFGYEKGSFTGANKEGKMGLVEAADGGTLFLDEINSLPLSIQGKILRTLEEKSIQRVGSTKTKKVDFRLIEATNRNLTEMVHDGTFREDLYYRLQVIPLTIPPVRERQEDIVPLCLHFLHHFCIKYNLQKNLSEQVLETLKNYDWPGNVREIRNFAERIVVMTPKAVKEINCIPPEILESHAGTLEREALPDTPTQISVCRSYTKQLMTKDEVMHALEVCRGHREQTAQYLGISKRKLQYMIKEYHLSERCQYCEKER